MKSPHRRTIARLVVALAALAAIGGCKLASSADSAPDDATSPPEATTAATRITDAPSVPPLAVPAPDAVAVGEGTDRPEPAPLADPNARTFAEDLRLLCDASTQTGDATVIDGLDWSFIESSSPQMLAFLKTLGEAGEAEHCGLVLEAAGEVDGLGPGFECPAVCADSRGRAVAEALSEVDTLPTSTSIRRPHPGPRAALVVRASGGHALVLPDGTRTSVTAASAAPERLRAALDDAIAGQEVASVLLVAEGGLPLDRLGPVLDVTRAVGVPAELAVLTGDDGEAEAWRERLAVVALDPAGGPPAPSAAAPRADGSDEGTPAAAEGSDDGSLPADGSDGAPSTGTAPTGDAGSPADVPGDAPATAPSGSTSPPSVGSDGAGGDGMTGSGGTLPDAPVGTAVPEPAAGPALAPRTGERLEIATAAMDVFDTNDFARVAGACPDGSVRSVCRRDGGYDWAMLYALVAHSEPWESPVYAVYAAPDVLVDALVQALDTIRVRRAVTLPEAVGGMLEPGDEPALVHTHFAESEIATRLDPITGVPEPRPLRPSVRVEVARLDAPVPIPGAPSQGTLPPGGNAVDAPGSPTESPAAAPAPRTRKPGERPGGGKRPGRPKAPAGSGK